MMRSHIVLGGLVCVWFLLMRQFGGADIYAVLGPYALVVIVVLWWMRPEALPRWLAPTPKAIAVGLAVGLGMTGATYPLYSLAVDSIPGFDGYIATLYESARTGSLVVELVWVTLIILAEEMLWRGLLLEACERTFSRRWGSALGLASYVVAQLGTGHLVVGAMALVCGAVWTLERKASDSLLAPLISHLIWTPTVIVLYPVT